MEPTIFLRHACIKNYILQGHIKKQDKERHYSKEIFMGLKFGQGSRYFVFLYALVKYNF